MKTVFYIIIAIMFTTSFTACTADAIADNEAPDFTENATDGAHEHVGNEDQGGN